MVIEPGAGGLRLVNGACAVLLQVVPVIERLRSIGADLLQVAC